MRGAGAGAGAALLTKTFGGEQQIAEAADPFHEDGLPPRFSDIHDPDEPEKAENWNTNRLEREIRQAIDKSVDTGEHVSVELPPGQILIDRNIVCEIKKGADISLLGNNNSYLKLTPEMSDIPKDRDSEGANSMLRFVDVEGSIIIDGITFDGGSTRAGKGGYKAPDGPWDSIVMITGSGPGADKKPEKRDESRKGEATVTNCKFVNTESAGCFMRNLSKAEMQNSEGKNFDALWCVAWSDTYRGRNLKAQNSLSDGLSFFVCDAGTLDNCQVKTARQGFLTQGSKNFDWKNCYAEDCGKGYDFYDDGDFHKLDENATLDNSHSRGNALAYSMRFTKNVNIKNSFHDEIGAWYNKDDFLHKEIARPEEITRVTDPMWFSDTDNDVKFSNVQIRKAKNIQRKYTSRVPRGIQTFGF